MFAPGSPIFIQVPEESKQRILHPCTVSGPAPSGVFVRPEEEGFTLVPGAEIRAYYELRQKFMQQAARVDAVLEGDPAMILGIQLIGQAVSAESRECYRVSTLTSQLQAILDGEQGRLADVSVTGLSIIARSTHAIGKMLPVSLHFEGRDFKGMASIQSIKELPKGFIRYGLSCLDNKKSADGLPAGLHKVSMAVQRTQLKRMAGTG